MEELRWYEFDQNNSGGHFQVDEKLCHRLIIQATSSKEAIEKAEELGCYWNGVANGIDCSCCGDRWSNYFVDPIALEKYINEGYEVSSYFGKKHWHKKYDKYKLLEEPKNRSVFGTTITEGKITFEGIEDYAQFMANEYGWTVPDIRIFYYNGVVKEIFANIDGINEM